MDMLTPLTPIVIKAPRTNWGTASIGFAENISLRIGNPTAEPTIHVCLIRPLVLGRAVGDDPDVHINLEAYEATQKGVSRQHASLTLVAKIVMLTDLESVNGTFLNGQRLSPNQHYIVRNGDEIRLGQLLIYIYL
ncbi:MAG: FHA domain-containing protein [Anaerolineae bacterium]|nr:FHA domain-containing protein [Anaerolineae bacterium]